MKQYKAFLSYSHQDEHMARKLHRALENYRPPRNIAASHTKTLGPIFRDQDEMSAAPDLSDKIKSALEQSEYLIVLASPAAQASRWVNQEIRFFRDSKGGSKILCALVHDNHNASFPAALLETGVEPLAANLTQGHFRLGVTQLAASIMNVGLDDLIQRDLKKLRRRVTAITVGASTALLVMGSLTWAAWSAQQLAEQRRQDAEGQIEFMITDLKDELESVGKLGPLNAVGQRAVNYYDGYPLSSHDADALGRRARVFHMLGEIQDQQGNFKDATDFFTRAYEATEALLAKSPDTADRVYDHSQSAYWVGSAAYKQEDYDRAEDFFKIYFSLANHLSLMEGDSDRAVQEMIYAQSNLGSVALEKGDIIRARDFLNDIIKSKLNLVRQNPDDSTQRISVADSYTNLAKLESEEGRLAEASVALENAITILENSKAHRDNYQIQYQRLIIRRSLANTYLLLGQTGKARKNADQASTLAGAMGAIEPDDVYLKYEIIQLDIFKFHLALSEDNAEEARRLNAKIKSGLTDLPDSPIKDYAVDILPRITASFPLYIAIFEDDNAGATALAEDLLHQTEAQLSNSLDADHLNKFFQPYLLSLSVLDRAEMSQYLATICSAENLRLEFQQRSALSTLLSAADCPAASFTQPHPTTSIRLAIQRIKSQ